MREDTVADEAKHLVFGPRENSYSHALDDHGCAAEIASSLLKGKLKESLSAEDIQLVMMTVKLSRLSRDLYHRDSLVDLIGYGLCLEETQRERVRRGDFK